MSAFPPSPFLSVPARFASGVLGSVLVPRLVARCGLAGPRWLLLASVAPGLAVVVECLGAPPAGSVSVSVRVPVSAGVPRPSVLQCFVIRS